MSRRLRAAVLGGLTAAAILPAAPAFASFGALDPGFGAGGVAAASFGDTSQAHAVARLSDGRLVVAGSSATGGREHVLLARYTALGALDPTFGAGGSALDQVGASADAGQVATALAVQADGKLVVAGDAGESWFVARYLPTGARDLPFAGGGVALSAGGPGAPAGGVSQPVAIAVQADGRIVVAGTLIPDPYVPSQREVIVARYTPSGQPDPSFGTGGSVLHQFGVAAQGTSASSRAAGLALLPDGRILIAGEATDHHGNTVALLGRYTAGGTIDGSFGDHGRVAVQLGAGGPRHPRSELSSLLLRADGSAVVAGTANDAAGAGGVLLAAFDARGTALPGFGVHGVVRAQYALPASAGDAIASAALTLSADAAGNLLVGGDVARPATAAKPIENLIALRYSALGRADCSARATPLRSSGRLPDRVLGLSAAIAGPPGGGGLVLAGAVPRTRRQVLLASLLGGAGGAAPPLAAATGAASRAGSHATLTGVGDPGCTTARYRFQYGSSRHYGHRTPLRKLSLRFGPQTVAATLTRKRSRGRLHYRLVLVRGGSTVRGRDAELRAR